VTTESVLLAMIGGTVGLLLAAASLAGLKLLRPAEIPRLDEVGISAWVIAFTFLVSLATGVACGLAPSWRMSRVDPHAELKDGGAQRKSFAKDRSRGFLIAAEVALSVLLTLGAVLLIRTFLHLQSVDAGFNPHGVTTLTFDMPAARYADTPQRAGLIREVVARAGALPGIESAGAISSLPLTGGEGFNRFGFTIDGKEDRATDQNHRFYARWITGGYLRAMGTRLVQGRDFSEADREGSAPVVIIDALLARRFFPGEDPIGKSVRLSYARSIPRVIVGVAQEVRLVGLDAEPAPLIYIPVLQEARLPSMTLVMRGQPAFASAGEAARAEIGGIDRNLPVYDVRPMTQVIADSIATRRFHTLLMGMFAALALLLAAVGIYGVMACLVGERQREIGIRIALGARRANIVWIVVRQGMRNAVVGAITGIAASLLLTRFLEGLLYGVSRLDVWSFGLATATVLIAALIACLVPAFRASHADPISALRR
jgi:predicted permease